MARRFILPAIALLAACVPLVGCGRVSREDAEAAIDQAALASQAEALMAQIVELGGEIPAEGSVEQAAESLATTIRRRIECVDATVSADTVQLDFGAPDRPCAWAGRTLSGCAWLRVLQNTADTVVVDHYWVTGSERDCHGDDFSDGAMTVDGTATVTWTTATGARQVAQHDIVWRQNGATRTASASGDLIEHALSDPAGVRFDGSQEWTSDGAAWRVTSGDIALAWDDFLPRSGTHRVIDPAGDELIITYERDADGRTQVRVEGDGDSFAFEVFER